MLKKYLKPMFSLKKTYKTIKLSSPENIVALISVS